MNVMAAMEDTMTLAQTQVHRFAQQTVPATVHMEYEHLVEMRDKMRATSMSYGKQCRWLGWMQATIVSWGVSSLDEMKEINRKHVTDVPERRVVVCLNDFPDGVFTSMALAEAYIEKQRKLYTHTKGSRQYHWHTHEFTTDKGAH